MADPVTKGRLRAQLGTDDPSSPANSMAGIWSILGGATKDTFASPGQTPVPYYDPEIRKTVVDVPDPNRRGQTRTEVAQAPSGAQPGWADWIANLGGLASETMFGRGAVKFTPRSIQESAALENLRWKKTNQGGFGPGERMLGYEQTVRDTQDLLRQIPKKEVQILGAEPVFQEMPGSTSWSGGFGPTILQGVQTPQGAELFRRLRLNPELTKVDWLGSTPDWRFSVKESMANHAALQDFLRTKYGIELSQLSSEPLSASRTKLYRRQGWQGTDYTGRDQELEERSARIRERARQRAESKAEGKGQ